MLTAADTFDQAQPRLLGLVKRSEAQTGSKMLAYEAVARRIGVSPSWIRKFLGNQPVGEPGYSIVANIFAAYHDACDHWDDVAAQEKRRFFELGGVPDEVAGEAVQRLGVDEGSPAPRTGPPARLVSDVVDGDRERLIAWREKGGRP